MRESALKALKVYRDSLRLALKVIKVSLVFRDRFLKDHKARRAFRVYPVAHRAIRAIRDWLGLEFRGFRDIKVWRVLALKEQSEFRAIRV